ncbi:hypothetical protein HD554DRAFT_2025478 [Boletus coccyginus]|nr:hypothetical protein HD554DRAFT_2025478 [Boletus coccyginus]
MTAAYAFMDYHTQGQMITSVIVDITTPPTGGLTLFNLYVALSRSSGCSSIQNDRLEELNMKTMKWWREMGQDTRTP